MIEWMNEFKLLKPYYKKVIDTFLQYLRLIRKIETAGAITESDIGEFLRFCFENNGVSNSKKTLEFYYEGLKEFYRYLVKNKYIQYSIFSNIVDHKNFKESLSLELSLRKEVSRGALSQTELEIVVDKINEYFESTDYMTLDKSSQKKNYIMFLIVRIYVKLSMLAPAKRKVICDLKPNDFDLDYKIVTINSQKIALPRNLTSEIKETLRFKKSINGNKEIEENQRIFDYIYGDSYNDNKIPSHLSSFSSHMDLDYILVEDREQSLKKKKYTTDTEQIANGAICELWRSGGIDLITLSKVCGVEVKQISNKLTEWVERDAELENILLNKGIRQVSYYNSL